MAIIFRAKPPPYAISWRVFQRIAEHRPNVRNFGKVRVSNALTVFGAVKRNFGPNSQSENVLLFCFNPGNNRTSATNCY
jgi:hypothetical protein